MTAVLHRVVNATGNNWDRYYDEARGAAVVYEDPDNRKCFGYVNGLYFESQWPDTAAMYDGDRGRPVGYRIRPEADGHWYLYYIVYSGDRYHRTEWWDQVL